MIQLKPTFPEITELPGRNASIDLAKDTAEDGAPTATGTGQE